MTADVCVPLAGWDLNSAPEKVNTPVNSSCLYIENNDLVCKMLSDFLIYINIKNSTKGNGIEKILYFG